MGQRLAASRQNTHTSYVLLRYAFLLLFLFLLFRFFLVFPWLPSRRIHISESGKMGEHFVRNELKFSGSVGQFRDLSAPQGYTTAI
ncbi:hypothetical protein SODALDRAFT_125126 [Sodiomyces alkalinus F11]|uniref:Uncharacterized protein n=1 Tax=Sodiomyces alkalinus (strain CBS 110278 / VKM F-3762 / F11) TaxID=1314773 RepID=A0A3N2Q4G8_SODAK|nr:hypothetical protein SODALDRAFT_125126 [Sodiomyces alkalinus F11]ROT41652.1 hypothetical protein SODALDRAFT_125126 [Sodiomyces alkalinus F11]